jgi:hypothetical protein
VRIWFRLHVLNIDWMTWFVALGPSLYFIDIGRHKSFVQFVVTCAMRFEVLKMINKSVPWLKMCSKLEVPIHPVCGYLYNEVWSSETNEQIRALTDNVLQTQSTNPPSKKKAFSGILHHMWRLIATLHNQRYRQVTTNKGNSGNSWRWRIWTLHKRVP